MNKIKYEELINEIKEEKIINVYNVECIIEQLIRNNNEDDDEDDDEFEYEDSARKKLKELARLFNNKDYKVYGTADNIHNCAIPYAQENMYDCACIILRRGLDELDYSVDLLADYIRYGISCGRYEECDQFYNKLCEIPKKEWNWRAYSFSIDYLLDKIHRTGIPKERNYLKRIAKKISNEFVANIGNDQAYFDRAQVIKILGDDGETEEVVLQAAVNTLKVAPRCALRMSNILFDRGEYNEAAVLLKRCSINAFKPQQDINSGYSFLLSALSKASALFVEISDGNFNECKDVIMDIYKDFNTAIKCGLNSIYNKTANLAIKIIESQTNCEYTYTNVDEKYDY